MSKKKSIAEKASTRRNKEIKEITEDSIVEDLFEIRQIKEAGKPIHEIFKGKSEPIPFPVQKLRAAADIYLERNKLYGDNYKRFGDVMTQLFPQGFFFEMPEDFNRLGILVQMVSKLTRYAENFGKGGHADSLDDLAVYAMMLQELDHDASN